MPETADPTFYRSPAAAIAAPPESLAYVAAFDPAGEQRDAMTVIDCDADSPTLWAGGRLDRAAARGERAATTSAGTRARARSATRVTTARLSAAI